MVIGIVGVFWWYRNVQKTPETVLESLPKGVDIVLNDVHHESTRHGVKEWVMDAGRAVYLNSENKVLFNKHCHILGNYRSNITDGIRPGTVTAYAGRFTQCR